MSLSATLKGDGMGQNAPEAADAPRFLSRLPEKDREALERLREELGLEADRFWSKTSQDLEHGCLRWTGAHLPNGYGSFNQDGRSRVVHHVVWELYHGPIPEGCFITHTCPNRDCLSLGHLATTGKSEILAKRWGSAEARLWNRVTKGEPDECWLWPANATKDANGFGVLKSEGRNYRVHRLSWELVNGEIPNDDRLIHTCANRLCVNPSHLKLVPNGELMHQAERAKGRYRPLEQRLAEKIAPPDANGCRVYTAKSEDGTGRGVIQVDRRSRRVNRVVWELERGEIPDDSELHNLCGNLRCVTPDHWELRPRLSGIIEGGKATRFPSSSVTANEAA